MDGIVNSQETTECGCCFQIMHANELCSYNNNKFCYTWAHPGASDLDDDDVIIQEDAANVGPRYPSEVEELAAVCPDQKEDNKDICK